MNNIVTVAANIFGIGDSQLARQCEHPSIGRECGSRAVGERDLVIVSGYWCGYVQARAQSGWGVHQTHSGAAC